MPRIEHTIEDTSASLQWKGLLAGTDHTVVQVPDLEVAIAWYQKLLGTVTVERRRDRVYLASPVTGRIALGLAHGGKGLEYVSFKARNKEAFGLLGSRLDKADVKLEQGAEVSRPGAADTLRMTIPTGHTLEVVLAEDDAPARPVDGEYRPGAIDVRTSHLQLRTNDVKGLTDYLGIMGFKSSLNVPLPNSDGYFIQFLRVNDFHHQVAILTGQDGIHHVALELDEVDFWRLLDNVALHKLAAEYGPVRHHEGNMMSLYIRDPFRNRLEITSPMEMVGFDYQASAGAHEPWYHLNMWGPQPPQTWEQEWM